MIFSHIAIAITMRHPTLICSMKMIGGFFTNQDEISLLDIEIKFITSQRGHFLSIVIGDGKWFIIINISDHLGVEYLIFYHADGR